jgi:hypothetical protein
MFKISQFYNGIIKVEDAFPVRLADNCLIGLSVHRWLQRTAPGAGSGVTRPDSPSRGGGVALNQGVREAAVRVPGPPSSRAAHLLDRKFLV